VRDGGRKPFFRVFLRKEKQTPFLSLQAFFLFFVVHLGQKEKIQTKRKDFFFIKIELMLFLHKELIKTKSV
jgi:hypothetical protein